MSPAYPDERQSAAIFAPWSPGWRDVIPAVLTRGMEVLPRDEADYPPDDEPARAAPHRGWFSSFWPAALRPR